MTDSGSLGPVSYLIVEFPDNKMVGEGFPVLVDLVDRGVIRILDLVFVGRALDGTVTRLELSDLDGDGQFDLSIFQGVSSGLLDDDDVREAGSVLEPGSSAGVLIFENRWASPFVDALRKGGAGLIAAGYIPQDTLMKSVEATDPS